MSDNPGNPTYLVALQLKERNRLAEKLIAEYVAMHGAMDVAVGLVGLIPGAAIPALVTAIGLQAPVIYQPLSRKLAAVYLAAPDDLNRAEDDILTRALPFNALLDMVSEFFGTDFITEIAGELIGEVSLGAAATFIPIIGAFVGAGLDYWIATTMTRRVGRMVAIYFQNGAQWAGSKAATYSLAKGLSDDLDDVRLKVREVRDTLLRNVTTWRRLCVTG